MYGLPCATIEAESRNASAASGNDPRLRPRSTGPVPKSIWRSSVSTAMSASGGYVRFELEQVVRRPGRPGQAREVADGRHRLVRERPQLVEVRAELARDRLRRLDERVDVVERGTEVHVGRVGRAHEVREPPDELGERLLLRAERARRAVQVVHERAELALLLRERRDEPRRVLEEALEHRRVVGQLAEEPAGRRQVRLQVREAAVGVVADTRVLAPPAAEEALDRLARLLVEHAEERVDLDHGRGPVGRDHGAVLEHLLLALRGVALAGRRQMDLDEAVGDRRQRPGANHEARAGRQRRVVVPHLELDLGLAVVGDLEVGHLADLDAAELDQVALDQLSGVDEARLQRVAVAAAPEQEQGHEHGRGDNRRHRRESGGSASVRLGGARHARPSCSPDPPGVRGIYLLGRRSRAG